MFYHLELERKGVGVLMATWRPGPLKLSAWILGLGPGLNNEKLFCWVQQLAIQRVLRDSWKAMHEHRRRETKTIILHQSFMHQCINPL